MIEAYKELICSQFHAALSMLSSGIDLCPDDRWESRVVNLRYCQAVFHALFFTDVYLGPNLAVQRDQEFHRSHAAEFGDYEELEDRPQTATYSKSFLKEYLQFCRDKVDVTLRSETEEILKGPSGFDWLEFCRAEVHVYNIRHVHHHAAQLSLWLREQTGAGIPWAKSGWPQ